MPRDDFSPPRRSDFGGDAPTQDGTLGSAAAPRQPWWTYALGAMPIAAPLAVQALATLLGGGAAGAAPTLPVTAANPGGLLAATGPGLSNAALFGGGTGGAAAGAAGAAGAGAGAASSFGSAASSAPIWQQILKNAAPIIPAIMSARSVNGSNAGPVDPMLASLVGPMQELFASDLEASKLRNQRAQMSQPLFEQVLRMSTGQLPRWTRGG